MNGSDGDSFVAKLIPQELGAGFTTAIAYRNDQLEVHALPQRDTDSAPVLRRDHTLRSLSAVRASGPGDPVGGSAPDLDGCLPAESCTDGQTLVRSERIRPEPQPCSVVDAARLVVREGGQTRRQGVRAEVQSQVARALPDLLVRCRGNDTRCGRRRYRHRYRCFRSEPRRYQTL